MLYEVKLSARHIDTDQLREFVHFCSQQNKPMQYIFRDRPSDSEIKGLMRLINSMGGQNIPVSISHVL